MHGSIFAFCSSSTRLPFEGIIAWCYLVDAIEVTQMNVDKLALGRVFDRTEASGSTVVPTLTRGTRTQTGVHSGTPSAKLPTTRLQADPLDRTSWEQS